ncbi:hypothetical protein [Roseomonas xinghualingensis]|uniref:hypothetical protein n=1 Tax=Roseomonas xinghualingensis TaxID=2986475 RepID=UPI0021F1D193|nr:hypothetical protein [Roseomonas sp. SXEYE001]MCV4207189.1 hypothetical protein [Roseomonas sp. SXEYE001]
MAASLKIWDDQALKPQQAETNLAPNAGSNAEAGQAALLKELTLTCERLLRTVEAGDPNRVPTQGQPEEVGSPRPLAKLDNKELAASLKRVQRLRARRRRTAHSELFEWPAWDMLLDLAAVRAEGTHLTVSAVCISSGAPQSTALRKLAVLERANLVRRYAHGSDGRRVCVALTDSALELVSTAIKEERALYQEMGAIL